MVTLINMVAVSMMSAKFATLAFLKLKILAHAIPSAAQLPRVWTRYSHDYTKPGLGQSRTWHAPPSSLLFLKKLLVKISASIMLRERQFLLTISRNSIRVPPRLYIC